jgi:hypothetical protein
MSVRVAIRNAAAESIAITMASTFVKGLIWENIPARVISTIYVNGLTLKTVCNGSGTFCDG